MHDVRGSLLWCALLCAVPLGARAQDGAARGEAAADSPDAAVERAEAGVPHLEEAQPAPALGEQAAGEPGGRQDAAARRRARRTQQEPQEEARDYAPTLMLGDAVAGSLMLVGTAISLACATEYDDNDENAPAECWFAAGTLAAGLGTYALASPITHMVHGEPARGVLSLILRVALPVGTGLFTAEADADAGVVVALVLGTAVTAVLLDWFAIAALEERSQRGAQLTPWVAPHAAGLGLRGSL